MVDLETLYAVTRENIDDVRRLCVLATPKRVDAVFAMLRRAREDSPTHLDPNPASIRFKILRKGSSTPIAVIDKDGRVEGQLESFVLDRDDVVALEELVDAECGNPLDTIAR